MPRQQSIGEWQMPFLSIPMNLERGGIGRDDDVNRFINDFPTKGRSVLAATPHVLASLTPKLPTIGII